MFKGSNVALVTPFKNNELDEETYIKLINFHLENGTNGLVPAGTTGESPTLSHSEHEKVIELCIKNQKERYPLLLEQVQIPQKRRYLLQNMLKRLELTEH